VRGVSRRIRSARRLGNGLAQRHLKYFSFHKVIMEETITPAARFYRLHRDEQLAKKKAIIKYTISFLFIDKYRNYFNNIIIHNSLSVISKKDNI
jgi:hypothetical protein